MKAISKAIIDQIEKIMVDSQESASMAALFDAGEFSASACALSEQQELASLAEKNGMSFDDMMSAFVEHQYQEDEEREKAIAACEYCEQCMRKTGSNPGGCCSICGEELIDIRGALISYDSDGLVFDAIAIDCFSDGDIFAITEAPENKTKEIVITQKQIIAIDGMLLATSKGDRS